MKKTLSLLLAAVLLLAMLAACGSSVTTTTPADGPELVEDTAPAPEPATEPEPENEPEDTQTPANVAGAEDMTEVEEVVEEGMIPVYAESLNDGVYPVVMKSSSSMFKADHCEVEVKDGSMTAILYMTSEAYPYMFAGTAAEAADASEDAYILPVEAGDFRTFTLPLNALDDGESFAAFSKRKELWYDRTLLFRADSLPQSAFCEGFFVTAESLELADGEYTASVTLSGGSGRASVTSPAPLTVKDGAAIALIEWSSPNYDYMVVDGEKYLPVNDGGNSAFEIPVSIFDRPMTVFADTTAMSQPHEIEYTLTFDSASIQAK